MMTIAEQILRAKDDYDAVYEAGKKAVGEVLKFIDVSSNSYRSIVPNGVEPFAKVNAIGGMSYKIGNELRSAKVSELKSEGANLIPFPYIDAVGFEIGVPIEKNGLTITLNEDGSIKVIGTATNETYINLCQVNFGEESAFGGGAVNGFYFTHCQYNATNLLTYVTIGKGVPIDSVYYPMVNRGTTALPYKPYVGTLDTLAIPEAIKSLDGYGLGVDAEYYNYIDFERKVFVQKIKKFVFTGDETIEKYPYGNYDGIIRFIGTWLDDSRAETSKLLCSHFEWGIRVPNTIYIGSGYSRGTFWIDVNFFTTETTNAEYEATFKAWLKEQYNSGNPVTVVYDLATPIETDISAYLTDEYIEVEGGGTISAVNEYSYDAPTNISYLIDRQGG